MAMMTYQNWKGMADIISNKCRVQGLPLQDTFVKVISAPWNDLILDRMQFIRNTGWWGNAYSVMAIEAAESSQNIS